MPHIHHHDNTNVGDWWSQPHRYFPLRPRKTYDIASYVPDLQSTEIHIVGGGGLGNKWFTPHLTRLENPERHYRLIAWGVGVDTIYSFRQLLDERGRFDLYGDYFSGFDDVGTRVFGAHPNFRWVPCVSCMHPAFFELRDRRPVRHMGVYQHQTLPLSCEGNEKMPVSDNSGENIVEKLEFLSQHEIIVTNTYHGVYWATLLNRKVICMPFKSGLFSFKHRPTYCNGHINSKLLESAASYPTSLEECRAANIEYYRFLTDKYGDI